MLDLKSLMSADMDFTEWIETVGNCYRKLTNDERNEVLDYLIQLSDASQLYFLSKKLNCLLKRDFIVQLPRELTFHLLRYLDPRSLLSCSCVSQQWNAIINSCNFVWRNICVKSGVVVAKEQEKVCAIKQVYLRMLHRMKHLRRGVAFDSMMLYGHTDRVMALYYHEGKIATGSDDRSVRVWDSDTGTCLKIFHTHTVSDIKFDDSYLVTASFDTTAACWDMDSGELLQRYTGHVAAVFSVDYNAELDVLVTGSADSTVKCWSLDSGVVLRTLPQHRSAWITQVRLSWNPAGGSTDVYFILSRDVGSVHMWQMDRRRHEMCYNEEWTNPFNDLVPGLQLDGADVSFATVDTNNTCFVMRTSLCRMREMERRRSCALSKDTCLQGFLGCGAHFDVLLCHGDQSHINIVRHSTGELVASLPLNVDYRPSKRGSSYSLGESGWLDGMDGLNDRGLFFATSVRDNGVYLLKWRQSSDQVTTDKERETGTETTS